MFKNIAASLVVAVCFWVAAAHGEQVAVTVDVVPAIRTTQQYDPLHPPIQMPTPEANEAGVTVSDFSCAAVVNGHVFNTFSSGPDEVAGVTVESAHITLRLYVSEWVSFGSGAKMLAHEDGHGMIALHFYAQANQLADTIGRQTVGHDFFGSGPDAQAAANDALNVAAQQIARQYMKQIQDSSQKVQDAYDHITQHGTNSVEEMDAIEQAMNECSHGRLPAQWLAARD